MPHGSGKNSLVGNIHTGTSRSKKKSTISKKAYAEMKRGWKPKKMKVKGVDISKLTKSQQNAIYSYKKHMQYMYNSMRRG